MNFLLAITAIIFFLLFTFAICGAIIAYFAPAVHGAPFVQTKDTALQTMIELAKVKPTDTAADLGSGDGKIVITLAKKGIETHGYETNPILVFKSRRAIKKAQLEKKAFIHWKSFWKQDLSSYSLIMVYGIPYIMEDLEKKLKKELSFGARIISNTFIFPHWKEDEKKDKIRRYTIKRM